MARNAAAVMAANEAWNGGDAGPIQDLIADDFRGPDGRDAAAFRAGFQNTLGGNWVQSTVVSHGPFVVVTGRGELADGSVMLSGWVAQFNDAGKITSYTALFAPEA
jgi:hypothetical protein